MSVRASCLVYSTLLISLFVRAARAGGTAELQADLQLRILENSSNQVVRAFVNNGRIRVYLTNQEQRLMLKAEWKVARVKTAEFGYASTVFKGDKSPPPMPPSSSGWREVRVLDGARSEQLLQGALRRLIPAQPGQGIYCQYAYGDVIVFCDRTGKTQIHPATNDQTGIQIVRRYTRQELASNLAQDLESDLRATVPGEDRFLLFFGRTNRLHLVLLDLEQQQAVVFYAPQISNDPRRSANLALKLSSLASFVLVDNAWAFLKNPISSATRTLNQAIQWAGGALEPKLRKRSHEIPPLSQSPGMDLPAWERWLDEHTYSERERGSVRLLIGGDQFFPLLERRLWEAQHKVDIHICIFDRDDVGVAMADLLKQRSTNLDVRVVFDRLNSRGAGNAPPATPVPQGFSPPRSIGAYLKAGAQVRLRPQPNPGFTCDHSKIILIDTHYAYLGGMNFGREYRYEWHDMMAEIQGPIVASFQRQFDKKWAQLGPWGDCGLAAETVCGNSRPPPRVNPRESIDLRRLYTRTFGRQIRRAELAAIDRASHHVFLENAYLYNNKIIIALVRARLRGVDVRVVMPSENDFGAGHKSNLVTANYLLQHGVRVYFYPGMSHIKALDVDGWICFGSANFDSLSLRLNREADMATSDAGFSADFRQQLFESDFGKSRELSEAIETSFGDEFADTLLNPL